MVKAKPSYEECRLRRVEENKKRMEALNLPMLCQALRKRPSIEPYHMKQVKPRTVKKQEDVVLRRSSRVANKAAPAYNGVTLVRVEIPTRMSAKRDLSNRVYASDEARAHAVEKAEILEARLGAEHPTFIKPMLQSHVTGGFWLFHTDVLETVWSVMGKKRNLPKRDEAITLIDEDGDEYPTIYLPRKTGLSGGWKAFAVAYGLGDGDALVFQLIRNTAFKVYIIRVNGSDQIKNLLNSKSRISEPLQLI